MSIYVYPTDHEWFRFLQARSPLEEVNFWQPGGSAVFHRLKPGDFFLFRLKSPINRIAGGGIFSHATLFPISGAWEAFGEANGVNSYPALFDAIRRYRLKGGSQPPTAETPIGCIVLAQPFFSAEASWIEPPVDYHQNLVQGKRFALESESGKMLLNWATTQVAMNNVLSIAGGRGLPMFGEPSLIRPRLGQGAFRLAVSDAYAKRCAVTGEKTLPVLDAAHIMPVAAGGEHRIDNGLLLRSDLHKLFDLGYTTITPDGKFKVSSKLKETWMNGRVYYDLDGSTIRRPERGDHHPSRRFLEWHNDTVYQG